MARWICPALALASALAFTACGDDDRTPGDASGRDATVPRDGGDGSLDAATTEDAGEPVDGAADDMATADAFTPADARPATDAGIDCADASILLDVPIDDTTVGGSDVRDPAGEDCLAAFASGPERVYAFTAPTSATFRITVTPTNATFDPMLYVQPACADTSLCLAIAGLNGPGDADTTDIVLGAGETVVITVDTDFRNLGDTSGGPFTLLVSMAP